MRTIRDVTLEIEAEQRKIARGDLTETLFRMDRVQTLEQLKDQLVNNDMAGSIFLELKQLLQQYPCMHEYPNVPKHTPNPPPMFYSEWIQCVVSKARIQGIEAALTHQYKHAEIIISPDISLETKKKIWEDYIKSTEGVKNEMEGTV